MGRAYIAAVALTFCACHPQVRLPPSPQAGVGGPGKPDAKKTPALATLHREVDTILGDASLSRGYWGVLVTSLKTGDTLYELNARRLFIPASNMKVVTLAAAAERLGWNYT